VDRRQPGVAGPGAVAPFGLEVLEERADQRCVEVSEVQLAGLFAGLLLGEAQQQPERGAVGGHRPGAGVALGQQPVGKERLERRGEQAHDSSLPG
jgi:hypothetical protein